MYCAPFYLQIQSDPEVRVRETESFPDLVYTHPLHLCTLKPRDRPAYKLTENTGQHLESEFFPSYLSE